MAEVDHDKLQEWCLIAMGGRVPMEARPQWKNFTSKKETRFRFKYEWITEKKFYQFVTEHDEVDFEDGEETWTVYIL